MSLCIYAFSMFKFSKSWLKGLSDDHWKMRDPHRRGLTRTSVGATLSRHTSGSAQQKTLELPVFFDVTFFSRFKQCFYYYFWYWSKYLSSGSEQNTYIWGIFKFLSKYTSGSLNKTFTFSGPEVHYSRLWMKYACSLLSTLININVHFSNSEYYYIPYPLL